MKKILLFALMLTAIQLGAQNKDAEAALKAYEKSKADVTGKKAQDAASWVRFGKNVVAVYDVPAKNLWVGLTAIDAKVVLKDQRSTGSESKELEGEMYNVVRYDDKDLYYNSAGQLAFWVITKPAMSGDLLGEAYNAFQKGYELDAKGSQKKDILEGLTGLQNRYVSEAMAANSLSDFSVSSKNFGEAVRCSEHPVVNKLDTVVVFYTGLTAYYAKEYERAITYIQRAVSLGYAQEGSAYSILADCYKSLGQDDKVEPLLAEGFTKYPNNQGILISLINLYLENDTDPSKVMDYIHTAQQNEPNNASLYYAEGNVWKKLDNNEKALECFKKSTEVDPNYFFGYISVGSMYYDAAVDVQNKAADEMDDNKYAAMLEELDSLLEKAIDPFEKSYVLTSDPDIQAEIVTYLRNIYYRLQSKSDAYKAAYEKYKALSETGE